MDTIPEIHEINQKSGVIICKDIEQFERIKELISKEFTPSEPVQIFRLAKYFEDGGYTDKAMELYIQCGFEVKEAIEKIYTYIPKMDNYEIKDDIPLEKVIKFAPKSDFSITAIGLRYMKENRIEECEEYLQNDHGKNYYRTWFVKGKLYEYKKNYDEATKWYQACNKDNQNYVPAAYAMLDMVFFDNIKYEKYRYAANDAYAILIKQKDKKPKLLC